MPHELSQRNKDERVTKYLNLLNRRRKSFLWKIRTGDENWIFDNLKRKKYWVDPGEATTSTPKRNSLKESFVMHLVGYQGYAVL